MNFLKSQSYFFKIPTDYYEEYQNNDKMIFYPYSKGAYLKQILLDFKVIECEMLKKDSNQDSSEKEELKVEKAAEDEEYLLAHTISFEPLHLIFDLASSNLSVA